MNSRSDSFKYLSYKCVVPGCITNRDSSDNYTTLFHFPQNNFLLEKWKTQMPFLNFHEIDLNSCLICELHFEAHHVIQTSTSSRKMLVMDAFPTLFGTNCYAQEYQAIPPVIQQYHTPPIISHYPHMNPQHHHPETAQMPSTETNPPSSSSIVPTTTPIPAIVSCRFCLKNISSDEMIQIDREIRSQFEDITNTELKLSAFFSSVSCLNCCRDLRKCSSIKYKLVKNQAKLYDMIINPKDSIDNLSSDGNAFTDFQMEMDGKVEVKLEVSDDMVKIKEEPGITTCTAWQHDPLEENTYEKYNPNGKTVKYIFDLGFRLFYT